MKNAEQRINNIIGQLEGIKRMLQENDADCLSLLAQLKAAKSATASLIEKIISEELERCALSDKSPAREKISKIIKEVMK